MQSLLASTPFSRDVCWIVFDYYYTPPDKKEMLRELLQVAILRITSGMTALSGLMVTYMACTICRGQMPYY